MKKILLPAFGGILLALSGCAFMGSGKSPEPVCHDLAAEKIAPVISVPLAFGPFVDMTGNGLRLVRRLADGTVRGDDLNRFSAPVGQLIRRRMTELAPPVADKALRVRGDLLRFEVDSRKNCAVMAVDYYLTCGKKSRALRHRIEVKTTGSSGTAGAAALEKCIIRSARQLGNEAALFMKQCCGKEVGK